VSADEPTDSKFSCELHTGFGVAFLRFLATFRVIFCLDLQRKSCRIEQIDGVGQSEAQAVRRLISQQRQ